MKSYIFTTPRSVRDYECEIEGIVNNSNYLNYTEHTRHLFLKEHGLSFSDMHNRGIDAVVARMTLEFKTPLKCDDEFLSCVNLRKEGLRYIFSHDLYRLPDNKLCFKSNVDVVCLVNGKLLNSEDYVRAFSLRL